MKNFLKSKTVIASIVSAICTILQILGIEILVGEQESIISGILALGQIGGALMAIYGRFVAKKDLTMF